jgi:hypothetical protein
MGTIIGSCQLVIINHHGHHHRVLPARYHETYLSLRTAQRLVSRRAAEPPRLRPLCWPRDPPPPVSPEAGLTWKKSESEASIDCGGSLKKPPYLRADRRRAHPLLRNNPALHFPQSLLFVFKRIFLSVCAWHDAPRARSGWQAAGGGRRTARTCWPSQRSFPSPRRRLPPARGRQGPRAQRGGSGPLLRTSSQHFLDFFQGERVALDPEPAPKAERHPWCGPGCERAIHALLKSQQDKEWKSKAAVRTFPDC